MNKIKALSLIPIVCGTFSYAGPESNKDIIYI